MMPWRQRARCLGKKMAKLELVPSSLTSRSCDPLAFCSMCTQEWSRLVTDRGEMYYFNNLHKTVSWNRPPNMGREKQEEGRVRLQLRLVVRLNLLFVIWGLYIVKDIRENSTTAALECQRVVLLEVYSYSVDIVPCVYAMCDASYVRQDQLAKQQTNTS